MPPLCLRLRRRQRPPLSEMYRCPDKVQTWLITPHPLPTPPPRKPKAYYVHPPILEWALLAKVEMLLDDGAPAKLRRPLMLLRGLMMRIFPAVKKVLGAKGKVGENDMPWMWTRMATLPALTREGFSLRMTYRTNTGSWQQCST